MVVCLCILPSRRDERVIAYLGPRGAQYDPVWVMSKVLIKSTREPAATSGVTAKVGCQQEVLRRIIGVALVRLKLTSSIVPEFVEAHALGHLGTHEARL